MTQPTLDLPKRAPTTERLVGQTRPAHASSDPSAASARPASAAPPPTPPPHPNVVPAALSGTLPFGLPALFYGVRMWAAVCLALFVAFRLELDDASWAGTTAAIVCQPAIGASLRKGWFRLIGTIIGAAAAVVLTACFPQSRIGFMVGLAVWGGLCAMVSSLLRNFAQYAAALAGYTTAIVAGAALGQVGGPSNAVFLLAINRASEILLGIVCASAVLALTDFGGARRRLGVLLAAFSAEIAQGLCAAFRLGGNVDAGRPQRRDLLRRAVGFGVMLDQAAGEISNIPFRPRALQAAVEGLYGAVSAWRTVATHLEAHPELVEGGGAAQVLEHVPAPLRANLAPADPQRDDVSRHDEWTREPLKLRGACQAAARRLIGLDTPSPSLRLLADALAEALLALSRTLSGIALLRDPRRVRTPTSMARAHVPDLLPPLLAGLRAFAVIAVTLLFWVQTAWPNGGTLMLFAAVTVILFAPREDAAYSLTMGFLIGTAIITVLAAVILFAVLPLQTSFAEFCLAIGVVLVPAGALSAQAWQQALFVAAAANFIPLLGPANVMQYDPASFYNLALALLSGVLVAAMSMRLLPPVSPGLRSRRLLALTLRDMRRVARGRLRLTITDWEQLVYGRLAAMPASVELPALGSLSACMFVGAEILRLRSLALRLGAERALRPALDAIARGDTEAATAAFAAMEDALGALPDEARARRRRLRARAGSIAVAEALRAQRSFFETGLVPR